MVEGEEQHSIPSLSTAFSTKVTSSHSQTNESLTASVNTETSASQKTISSSSFSAKSVDKIMTALFGKETSLLPTEKSPKTYKIVMDNIDKTIKPADMRVNNQTRSLHYVHKFAVRDRLDLSGFDDKPRRPNITDMQIRKMLPSKEDETAIHYNMSLLIARILVENLDFLSSFKRSLGRHIPHQYSQEMSQQSTVVSCCTGIQ